MSKYFLLKFVEFLIVFNIIRKYIVSLFSITFYSIYIAKSISDKCDMTGGFLTCIDRKMGASYVKKHKNSLESGYDRAVNDMMAAFKNEYLNSLSI